jgi:hypothetical protein
VPDSKIFKKKSVKAKKLYLKKNSSSNNVDIEIASSEEDNDDLMKK